METLRSEHSSAPYNPAIANTFFRAGEIEAWGRGIQRIFEACRAASSPEPQLRISGHDLWLEFPFSSEYLKAIATPEVTDPVKGEVTGEVEAPVETPVEAPVGLSETEQKILHGLAKDILGRKDLLNLLGYSQKTGNYKSAIARLSNLNLIEYTIPEKPNSRLQKYRLTEKGRTWLSRKHP